MNPRNNAGPAHVDIAKPFDSDYRVSERVAGKPECKVPLELWEPPFERWLKLADNLLRDWPRPLSRKA